MRLLRAFFPALAFAALSALTIDVSAQAPARRALRVDDMFRIHDVRDPQISPDGQWVAYVVSTVDSAKDRSDTDIWMTSWDGAQTLRVTSSPDGEGTPRWSPDGRYLSFVSSRNGGRGGQLWLLDRRGGEAVRATDLKSGIGSYEWAPDAKRLVFAMGDPDPEATTDTTRQRTPKPIVLDRYHFKQDIEGYLGNRRQHLYLFNLDSKRLDTLTTGAFDESNPAWSPDGKQIAFVSKRGANPDRTNNTDVFTIDARAGATARQLTTFDGPDGGRLAWSPDGQSIAYVRGSDPKYVAYNMNRLAVIPAAGGEPRILTPALDRPVSAPTWTTDGSAILVLVVDDRAEHLARVALADGKMQQLTNGRRAIGSYTSTRDGRIALLAGTSSEPGEVHAFDGGSLRRLSHQNDAWLADVQLGTADDITFKSKDGTEVHGLMLKPPTYVNGSKYPTLLRIHGGPVGQDQHSFSFEHQFLAANGYVVVSPNYRGSNGRGEKYTQSIFADWGNREVQDILAATDYVVSAGVADPEHLGIGGWSYGGILTDYTIATTPRFKAATSGAGSALQTTMYGMDQYTLQYDTELGPPWKNPELWIKLSYPFYHADRIKTPTLFLGGEKDFNVPVAGGEQMYQALKSLGIDTEMIIYPGQFHGITRPSYQRDRLQRYVSWYDKYLKPGTATSQNGVRE
jgi:dipeptidyl aminopeptidase/acylaminoacyl peptidase